MQLKITKPLTELQQDAYDTLRADLYTYITETNDFPEWKQVNLSDRWSVLKIKETSVILNQTELDELTAIEAVRTWKDNLLLERQRVKELIFNSVSKSEIIEAVNSFVFAKL